ncbi:MAG TPA: polyhydroxyalkanoate depolymerase [Burkholderiales bacterium]
MLYSLFEAQHAALEPMRLFADAARGWFGHPFSPFAHVPGARRMHAGSDLFLRVTQRYGKPAWGIDSVPIDGVDVPVRIETLIDKPFCRLLHFRRETAAPRNDPRVLLVAPLSGHYATLLRDTVRALLPAHEVWITDWSDARMVPLSEGAFHLDDYVDYVREFVRHLSPELNVISVCQPTVPVLAALSLMAQAGEPDAPRTMIMMGGPIDARRSPTAVNGLATRKPFSWFERELIQRVPVKYPGYMRRVYPGFLQHFGFAAMNADRHVEAHRDYFQQLVKGDDDSAERHRDFYDEYNAVLDLPAEYYLDTIRTVFQDFDLPQGRMRVREERVQPQAIRDTALLTIEGELDDISGFGQTEAAHQLCTGIDVSRREHYRVPKAGHYGIFSGRRWRELVCPRVAEFIRAHAA